MKKAPTAPPVYRPCPQPRVLQRKKAAPTAVIPFFKRGGQSIQRALNGSSTPAPPTPAAAPPPPPPAQAPAQAPPRVRVGGPGAGAMFLASSYWTDNTAFNRARTILGDLQRAGTEFDNVAAIVAHVNADAQVIAAVAAAAAAAAAAARVVGTLTGGVSVRVSDIRNGIWGPIPARRNGDHELFVRLDETYYSLHVHPPPHRGRQGVPGEVMRAGRETGTQTPQTIIDEILAIKGRPAGW